MSEDRIRLRVRPPKPGTKYYLPKGIFRSTVAFCLAYKDLKTQKLMFTGIQAAKYDGSPRGTDISDPTSREAEKLARLEWKISVIEDSVKKCSGEILYPYMLRAVTEDGCGFVKLKEHGMPLNRNDYTVLRRKIYFEVAKEI